MYQPRPAFRPKLEILKLNVDGYTVSTSISIFHRVHPFKFNTSSPGLDCNQSDSALAALTVFFFLCQACLFDLSHPLFPAFFFNLILPLDSSAICPMFPPASLQMDSFLLLQHPDFFYGYFSPGPHPD